MFFFFLYFCSCEVRPGPQFFTRHITIFRNGTWEGYFYRYNDSQCSEPKLSLHVRGYLKLSLDPVKDTNKAHFNFTRVNVYPHNEHEQQEIVNVSNRHCPNSLRVFRSLRSGIHVFEVNLRAFRKRACRNSFGISESEFSKLKLETRRRKGSKYDKLYFAEIPTIRVTRHKPKSYQLPLQRYNANNCTICRKIQSGTGVRPPKLPQVPPLKVDLEGEWASTTCETTSGGALQTRHFKFNKEAKKWECHYFFYHDAACKDLEAIIQFKGRFKGGISSKKVAGAYDYVFTMTQATITPTLSFVTELLNSAQKDSCGKVSWKTNVAQNITPTFGCAQYGISLPDTEYDLVKMEKNPEGKKLLYVGQRASDGTQPSSPSRRPTSFYLPLVECSSYKSVKFVPPTTRPTTRLTTRAARPFPTLREKPLTTRRRTDRETIGKATSKKNEQIVENITKKPGDIELAYRSSAINWSLCNLLIILFIFNFVIA